MRFHLSIWWRGTDGYLSVCCVAAENTFTNYWSRINCIFGMCMLYCAIKQQNNSVMPLSSLPIVHLRNSCWAVTLNSLITYKPTHHLKTMYLLNVHSTKCMPPYYWTYMGLWLCVFWSTKFIRKWYFIIGKRFSSLIVPHFYKVINCQDITNILCINIIQ